MAIETKNNGSMQTIDRAMLVLRSFSKNESVLSLADLHKKTGLSKSSLQRILNSLVYNKVMEKDDRNKTYKLGIELYFLAQLVDVNAQIFSIAKPYMEVLRDKYGESVSLNIIKDGERICIGYFEGSYELTALSYIGQTSPLYAGASAKVLLAYLSEEEQQGAIEKMTFERIANRTIPSKEKLMEEIKEIRQVGYAFSYEERVEGGFSTSAPIKNRENELIASVSMAGPIFRVNEEKIKVYCEELIQIAEQISNDIVQKTKMEVR